MPEGGKRFFKNSFLHKKKKEKTMQEKKQKFKRNRIQSVSREANVFKWIFFCEANVEIKGGVLNEFVTAVVLAKA